MLELCVSMERKLFTRQCREGWFCSVLHPLFNFLKSGGSVLFRAESRLISLVLTVSLFKTILALYNLGKTVFDRVQLLPPVPVT